MNLKNLISELNRNKEEISNISLEQNNELQDVHEEQIKSEPISKPKKSEKCYNS